MKQLTVKVNLDLLETVAGPDTMEQGHFLAERVFVLPEGIKQGNQKDHVSNLEDKKTMITYEVTNSAEELKPNTDKNTY